MAVRTKVKRTRGTVLIDSNVLLDIVTDDPEWGEWSFSAVGEAASHRALAINAVIYAEVSVSFATAEDLERVLPASIERLDIPYAAAFLAGKSFRRYRKAGGLRTSTLPDFFIGAHAAVTGMALLTRDVLRYRTYFPELALISPD